MGKTGGQKGSMNKGFIEFQGCENCSSNKCPTWKECEDILENQGLLVLPSVHSTKSRWIPRGENNEF